jgi:Protein of unknown function (DUF2550)
VSGQPELAVTLALLLALAAAGLVLRNALIGRRRGVVECALRAGTAGRWRRGLAEYQRSRLCWHRSLSLRLRPCAAFDRADLHIASTRLPTTAEATRFGPGVVVAECTVGDQLPQHDPRTVELALSDAALTGLLAWLESSPEFYLRAS